MPLHSDYVQRNPNALVPLEHDPYVVTLPDRLFVVWVAEINGRLRWQIATQFATQFADGPRTLDGPPWRGLINAADITQMVHRWWASQKATAVPTEGARRED